AIAKPIPLFPPVTNTLRPCATFTPSILLKTFSPYSRPESETIETATPKSNEKSFCLIFFGVKGEGLAHKSPSSNANQQHDGVEGRRRRKHEHEVHLITGASESVVADSERKNGIYAILIGVRILSLFLVLLVHGWLQIVIFVVGMLAPWIGVQIANNIRQVDGRSIQTVPPQQAA